MKMLVNGDGDSSSTSETEDEDGEVSCFNLLSLSQSILKYFIETGLGFRSREAVFSDLGITKKERSQHL
jgi:hypothetical protein